MNLHSFHGHNTHNDPKSRNHPRNALTVHNIPKIKIKDLIQDMLMYSSILAFVDFKDIMLSNPNYTYYGILSSLVRRALEEHEKVCPLVKRSRIYLNECDYTFVDNFDAFLECKISEEFTTLIPRTTPYNFDTSLLHSRRSWIYNRPVLQNTFSYGSVYCDYITSYPVRMSESPEEKDFTDESYIYYMDLFGGPSNDYLFKRQFYLQILNYLKGVANNLRYPDMPIELLSGVQEEYSLVQSELQDQYRKANTHGRLYR